MSIAYLLCGWLTGPSETPTKKKKGEVGSISPLEYIGERLFL